MISVFSLGPMSVPYPLGGTRMESHWKTLCLDTAHSCDRMEIGKKYSRYSKRYVKESMRKWVDAEGIPLRLPSTVEDSDALSHIETARAEGLSSSQLLEARISETSGVPTPLPSPLKSLNINFVAMDFAIYSAT